MRLITKYSLFEKMGIVSELEKIADDIIEKFKTKDEFTYTLKYNDEMITINCVFNKNLESNGNIVVKSFNDKIFTLNVKNKNAKSTIIHELKHIDRKVRTGKHNYHTVLDSSFDKLSKSYEHLFRDRDTLHSILYYTNPEEFESYYNNIFYDIKEEVSKLSDNNEKRKTIDRLLNKEEIFQIYKFFNNIDFEISLLFKNKKSMNFFLSELSKVISTYSPEENRITFNRPNNFKKLVNLLKSFYWSIENKDDIKSNHLEDEINKIVNKSVKDNYRKFYRIYSLLI